MALIKCPECGKEISDKSEKCIYCGYPLHNFLSEINKTSETMGTNNQISSNKKNGGCGTWIIAIMVFIGIISGLGACSNGSTIKSRSEECYVCGKTYTNKDDVHSIIMTNMCEPCYNNYKYTQDMLQELQKYNERYNN